MMRDMISLSQYMERENTTQAALAEKLGVSASTISLLLSGKRKPSAILTKRIEAVTGIHRHLLRPDVYEAAQ